ncbi:MAG TPA: adenine deaminase [Candidatus Bathyarchaeia archaeon]|nr:adenine deaminase [Candidatus Bathyarchaeia archaeon]
MSSLLNNHRRTNLYDVTKSLVATALGKEKADLVIKNGNLVNVNSGELLEGLDVAVKKDRVAFVGKADHTVGPQTVIYDAGGKYLAPGFVDGHIHVESSMLTVTQFANAVLPFGTTTCFIDPHEIANVLGLKGVRLMLEEGRGLPLKVFVSMPSCIPAARGFENGGAVFGQAEVEEAMQWDGVAALGEVMNYPGVLAGDDTMHGEIAATLRAKKVVEGHDVGLLGTELTAYAAAGITSSHECTRKIEAIERVRNGMYAMLREGSAWLDMRETVRSITETGIDSRHVCVVTDDKEPDSIIRDGHVNHSIRRAIQEGVDPITAIQMGSLNPAEHFEKSREIGSIAPSRLADIVVLDSLTQMKVHAVFADGIMVAKEGKMVVQFPRPNYPDYARKSIHLSRMIEPKDIQIKTPIEQGEILTRIIQAIEGSVLTKQVIEELPVKRNEVLAAPERTVLKTAVIERHKGTGNIGLGFTKGFAFREGAVATTVAHDSHNILVVGSNDQDMVRAVQELEKVGGGIVTVVRGNVTSLVKLPIAGLMSDQPVQEVAKEVSVMYADWRSLGCTWVSPFMTMSLLALSVLPELRLTDLGLLDTNNFKFVELFPK